MATTYERDNILRVYALATQEDIAQGMTWYQTAHDIALQIGSGDIEKGAAMLAVTSPNCSWEQNVKIAKGTSRGIKANIAKMQAIASGDDTGQYLKTSKVKAFYNSIVSKGLDRATAPCIDTHALGIALGFKVTGSDPIVKYLFSSSIPARQFYISMQLAYMDAAFELQRQGVIFTPVQLQAVTWVTWRRLVPAKNSRGWTLDKGGY